MKKARLWGLLWMSFILELQGAAKSEEQFTLTEGQTLKVTCPFSVQKQFNSQKAWQRLRDGQEPQTLVITKRGSEPVYKVQEGRYLLEEIPSEGMLLVQVIDLRVEDSGLYRCVIHQPPTYPMLHNLIRLVVTKDSAPDNNPNQNSPQISTLPPATTKPVSTASPSSPGLGGNSTHGTNSFRMSQSSIITVVVCGILSKSLVFTFLLVITQRSFNPRSMNPQECDGL